MPHMVVFRTNEGKQAYHPTDALEDAIRFVEHLRNAEQVTDVHVFRMQEVPLEFKVLYKVEVGPASGAEDGASGVTLSPSTPSGGMHPLGGSDESMTTASSATAAPVRTAEVRAAAAQPVTTASAPAAPAPVAAPAPDSGGRFGLFSRSS